MHVTYLLILLSTLCTLSAQLLLKQIVGSSSAQLAMAGGVFPFIINALTNPLAWLALSIQVVGYLVWLFVLGREKMAVAIALSGSFFYILASVAAWALFSERLTLQQWSGIVLISAGVVLVANRP